MNLKLTLLLLLICSTAFAQSKKKMNVLFTAQHDSIKKAYDSLYILEDKIRRENRSLRSDILSAHSELVEERAAVTALKSQILSKKKELVSYGVEVETLVSEDVINGLCSGVSKRDYVTELDQFRETTETIKMSDLPDISDQKIKIQNELLSAKINEYQGANERLQQNIAIHKELKEKLSRLKTSSSEDLLYATQVKTKLTKKAKILDQEITKVLLEKEEERIKAEELAALAAKKKGKNKTKQVFYTPPVITDDPFGETVKSWDHLYDDQTIGSFIGEDDAVPPGPEIKPQTPEILDVYEESPEFPGGMQALKKFLAENLKYPQTALELEISGKCYIKFIVSEKGDIGEVKVIRGVSDCPECDKEAVRVVKAMPLWSPGKNNGKPVKCWFTLPVNFIAQ